MPQLSDIASKRKFVKKEYRPWDLSGSGTVDGKEKSTDTPNKQTDVVEVSNLNVSIPETIEKNNTILVINDDDNLLSDNEKSKKTDNKEITNLVTNKEQSDNKQVTKKIVTDNIRVTNREQTENISGNISDNSIDSKYLINTIVNLSGIQKDIFNFIINLCAGRGQLNTGNVLIIDIANQANCTTGSAKTSLHRLVEKKVIQRLPGRACRGGYMIFGISKEIQDATIQAQQILFNPVYTPTTGNRTGNKIGNINPYSSSSIKINTTTSLPEAWQKINFIVLEEIGFSQTQLKQLHDSQMIEPDVVQDSINRFAYSLEHNAKVKAYSEPLSVLMGVLRKGQRWNESNYIDPKEKALREMLEEARKKKEEKENLIKELISLEFPEWKKSLSEEEIRNIVPEDTRKTKISAAIDSSLRTYFTDEVLFPRLKLERVI